MFGKQKKTKLEQKSAGLLFRIPRLERDVEEAQQMVRLAIRQHGYGSVVHKTNVDLLEKRTKTLDECRNALATVTRTLVLSR